MNHAVRAAIASAFIFPGAGHFLLRHYVRGLIFAVPALFIVCMLFINLMQVASSLSAQINTGTVALDPFLLFNKLHLALFESPYWAEGKWVLLASWVLSIVSAYFVGRKRDLAQPTP